MTTGLATVEKYFELVSGDLEDALGAHATLLESPQALAYGRPDPRTMRVRIPGGTHVVELTRRAPVFSGKEAKLVAAYADALEAFGDVPRVFATTASEDVLTRAIAVRCATLGEAEAVELVIQAIVRHATRTYEGSRVAVNICLDLSAPSTGEELTDFLLRPWAPILGSGLQSAVLLASDGSVIRMLDLPAANTGSVMAPEALAPVATWTAPGNRVALTIGRSGEVYLFTDGELLLARRSAQWRGFPVDALRDSGWFGTTRGKLAHTVKTAVLTALIDASAAHHGACIGIVVDAERDEALHKLVDVSERWDTEGNRRRDMFGQHSFLDLSRRHRLELLSMDGATLLDQAGRILAAGAILRVDGGSPGGGRTAAALAIGRHGVGIKVSQDGPITAYARDGGTVVPHFSMG